MRRYYLVFAMAALVAILAGCVMPTVEEAQHQVEEAESVLCASIKVYKESVADLEDVSASTTVEELKEMNQTANAAFSAMIEAAGDLKSAEIQAAQSAVAEFEDTAASIPNEASLGEAAIAIQESANAVQAALQQLHDIACVEPGIDAPEGKAGEEEAKGD